MRCLGLSSVRVAPDLLPTNAIALRASLTVLYIFSLKLDISYALMLWYPKILLKYYSYARALALCMRLIGTFIYRQNEFHDYYTK